MAQFELDQKVVVITDEGVTYDALIVARAKGDDGGRGAYKVTLIGSGHEHQGQWHKATDVFLPEQTAQEKKDSWNEFLNE
jgi:hypothetical protein